MDPDLETVIRQALDDARGAGKDQITQTKAAVRAVLKVRPDMTISEASRKVEVVRRRLGPPTSTSTAAQASSSASTA